MNTMTKQLSDLKKGDQVVVRDYPRGLDSIETIKSVTKRRIILSGNRRYAIKDGKEVSTGFWNRTYIQPATPQRIAQVKRQDEINLAIKVNAQRRLYIDSLSAEIAAVNELLDSAKQYGDLVGEKQLKYRLKELTLKLESLETDTIGDNVAAAIPHLEAALVALKNDSDNAA